MVLCANYREINDGQHNRINQPHELSLEEKDELLFALMEHLNLAVYRPTYADILFLAPSKG